MVQDFLKQRMGQRWVDVQLRDREVLRVTSYRGEPKEVLAILSEGALDVGGFDRIFREHFQLGFYYPQRIPEEVLRQFETGEEIFIAPLLVCLTAPDTPYHSLSKKTFGSLMAYARRSNYVDYSRRSVRYKLIDPRVNPIQEANPKFHASIIAYLPERRIWLKITNSGRDARRHPFVEEVSDYRRGSGTFLVGVGEEIPYDYALSDRWQLNALTD